MLATVALGLAFNGAGKWSLDHAIGWDVSGLWWGIGATGAALVGAAGVLANAHRRSTPSPGPLGSTGRAAGAGPV
jgi:putative oxidoreductase